MPQEVAVTAKDKTATITWNKVNGAATYILYRDGAKIADVATNSYNDTDLAPENKIQVHSTCYKSRKRTISFICSS